MKVLVILYDGSTIPGGEPEEMSRVFVYTRPTTGHEPGAWIDTGAPYEAIIFADQPAPDGDRPYLGAFYTSMADGGGDE